MPASTRGMTVGEIVGEGPLVHGLSDRAKREELVRELLAKVGLNQTHIRRYPHEFSAASGSIGIARALALNPEFIVCDEPCQRARRVDPEPGPQPAQRPPARSSA